MSDNVALQTKTFLPEAASAGQGSGESGSAALGAARTIDTYAQVGNRMLSNQNAMLQYQARQRAGAIIAAAPDFDTGIAGLTKDPLVAAMAPDVVNSYRQTQQVLTQTQGAQATQNRDAVQMVLQAAAGANAEPGQLPKLIGASMATLPKEIQARIAPAVKSFTTGLLTDLPSDPAQAKSAYTSRLVGLLTSAGMSPETVAANVGSPSTIDAGNTKYLTLNRPGQAPQVVGEARMGMAPRLELNLPGPNGTTFPGIVSDGGGVQPLGMGGTPGAPATMAAQPPATGSAALGAGSPQPTPYGGGRRDLDNVSAPPSTSTGQQPLPTTPGDSHAATQPAGGPGVVTPPGTVGVAGLTPPPPGTPLGSYPSAAEKARAEDQAKADVKIRNTVWEKYNAAAGESAGKIDEDVQQDAQVVPGMIRNLDTMVGAMGQFQAGGGAETRASIGQFMQGLRNAGVSGISQEAIDKVANGSLSGTQFFMANVRPQMVQALKEAAKGTGRVMKTEVDAFLNSINASTDPAAVVDYLNKAKFALRLGLDRADQWSSYRDKVAQGDPSLGNKKLQDYYTWYATNRKMDDLPTSTPSGINLAPYDPKQVLGGFASQSTPTSPAAVPGHPAGIQPGWQFSPSRQQYRDPATGKTYDKDGKPL